MAREAAEAEKKASYQLDVEETEIRLAEELSEVCRDYCDVTWDKALTVAEVPANSILRLQEVSITIHRSVRSLLPPLLLPLPQNLPSNLWQSQMPSLFLKFQRNPTKLVTKASGLREKKARKKTRGKSPLPRPKMQPKCRKQRSELRRLILRSRMLLAFSQARRRILLLKCSP